MLLTFKNMSNDDMYRMIHSVYSEASYEVAKKERKTISEAEQYYVERFLEKFKGRNEITYYVLKMNEEWVSALRLIKNEDFYFIEALETAPEQRRKGYASKLIKMLLQELEDEHVVIRSNVRKTNIASLVTHQKCGFVIEEETEDCFYRMLYQK